MEDLIKHAQARLGALHAEVYGLAPCRLEIAAAYFAWSKWLFDHGSGIDRSGHPRNPFKRP